MHCHLEMSCRNLPIAVSLSVHSTVPFSQWLSNKANRSKYTILVFAVNRLHQRNKYHKANIIMNKKRIIMQSVKDLHVIFP